MSRHARPARRTHAATAVKILCLTTLGAGTSAGTALAAVPDADTAGHHAPAAPSMSSLPSGTSGPSAPDLDSLPTPFTFFDPLGGSPFAPPAVPTAPTPPASPDDGLQEARGYHDQAYDQRNAYVDQAIGGYEQAGGDPTGPEQANGAVRDTHDSFYGMFPS
jgi:hypothetical protein